MKKMNPPLARAARIRLGPGPPQCMAQGITHLPSTFQAYWCIQMASSTAQTRQCTEGVQIGCACIARASCTPAQFFGQHLVALVEIHQYANFGVARSTFPRTGGPLAKNVFRPSHVRRAPLGDRNYKGSWFTVGVT